MKRVLVVDDEGDIRSILREALELEGYRVLEAADGLSAVEKVQEQTIDAVILDLNMPGLDGLETLKEIKRIALHIPIIMLTGCGDIPATVTAMKFGAHDFFVKPPDFDNLIAVIKEATETRHNNALSVREGALAPKDGDEKNSFHDIKPHVVQRILKVKEHIERNYTEAIGIADACRLSGLSKTYFCCFFKRITGHSLKSYQSHVRMQKAKELMADKAMNISDIAFSLGYTDATYFSTAFKKATGSSPRKHRYSVNS